MLLITQYGRTTQEEKETVSECGHVSSTLWCSSMDKCCDSHLQTSGDGTSLKESGTEMHQWIPHYFGPCGKHLDRNPPARSQDR